MKQTFTIRGRLDGLNEYTESNRYSKYDGNLSKRANEDAILWAIKAAHLKQMKTPVRITAHWYEGKKQGVKKFRPRDKDNIRFGMKFIQDALVKSGIIEDDSFYKVTPNDTYDIDKDNPRIVVEIEEINADN